MLAFLTGGRQDYRAAAGPALRHLERAGYEVELTSDPSRLADPSPADVVLAASDAGPLGTEEAQALAGWVVAGGGLIALHRTMAAWSENEPLAAIAGFRPGELTPVTELVVRPVTGHPVTDRMAEEFFLPDRLQLTSDGIAADATRLLTVSWRYADQVAAFTRAAGAGTFVHLGLGGEPAAYLSPALQQFVLRSVRHAAGAARPGSLGVGLAGYGAIAADHARQIEEVAGLHLAGVCDLSPRRREQAARELEVPVSESLDGLLAQDGVDVVVVGTPPSTHAEVVLQALGAGKHVVCEKPFALSLDEVDRMISAARDAGRVLTVYQSRRWDPDFVALRRVVESGTIGVPFHLESFIGGYGHPCSYWHSHEPISGGTIFDWGSHYIDWTLQLIPDRVTTVSAVAQTLVWHDVTNSDHVNVDIRFAGGAQATFLHSDIAVALKPKWYLLATAGGVVGDWELNAVVARGPMSELVEDRLAPADSPARLTVHRPNGEGGVNSELLALPRRQRSGFYRNLGDHLLSAEPLAVTPEEARRNIAVMEAAARSVAQGGAAVKVDV